MKTAIMQPYIFPYIGYYQLINAVDKFVILDDVNFIMRGWINRNNILLNGKTYLFSIPLDKPSQNKLIMHTELNFSNKQRENFLKTIELAYKKAPFFQDIFPLIQDIIFYPENNLADFSTNSLISICNYFEISTSLLKSSEIKKDSLLKAQDKIIQIVKELDMKTYINPIGGVDIYDKEKFSTNGLELKFLKTNEYKYPQFKNEFIPNLSIIDILMFNTKREAQGILKNYTLI